MRLGVIRRVCLVGCKTLSIRKMTFYCLVCKGVENVFLSKETCYPSTSHIPSYFLKGTCLLPFSPPLPFSFPRKVSVTKKRGKLVWNCAFLSKMVSMKNHFLLIMSQPNGAYVSVASLIGLVISVHCPYVVFDRSNQ